MMMPPSPPWPLPPRARPWVMLLEAEVRRHERRPFEWGVHDCCTFAADVVQALTGVDPMMAFRGTYLGQLGAARLLREHGGLMMLAANLLGNPVPAKRAGRGDVVLYTEAGNPAARPALGVCMGAVLAAPGPDGLAYAPMAWATHAWPI